MKLDTNTALELSKVPRDANVTLWGNTIIVQFPQKPGQEVINALKAMGFKWNRERKEWVLEVKLDWKDVPHLMGLRGRCLEALNEPWGQAKQNPFEAVASLGNEEKKAAREILEEVLNVLEGRIVLFDMDEGTVELYYRQEGASHGSQ